MHHASNEFKRAAQPFLSGERETYATVLLGIVLTTYGAVAMNWDPAVLEAQLKEDFGVESPDVVYNQLMALINVMVGDTCYTSVETFDHTISFLCRTDVNDQDAPSPHELAWCAFEMLINDPDPYHQGPKAQPFGHDIQRYCGVVLADAGFKKPPMTLRFAKLPSWAPKDLSEDPDMSNAASASEDDLSGEVDRFVESQAGVLIQHLTEIGIRPAPLLLGQKADLPQADPLAGILPA